MNPSSDREKAAAPRRILLLHTTSEVGGSDVSLLRLVETLDRARFQPIVALPGDGPLVARLRALDCPVLVVERMLKLTSRRGRGYLLRYGLNYPGAVRVLARLVREHHIDLVHTNTIHNLYGVMAAKLARRPHVWHVREIVWQIRWLRRLEVFLTRYSDRVIVTSGAVGAMFGVRRRAELRHVPNGVHLGDFHPDRDGCRVRAELGLAAAAPLAGVVCRLDIWKGVDTFLRAVVRARAALPEARYAIVGGPIDGLEAYADQLARLASSLGVADVVQFTGWRYHPADMPEVYAALDVLVLPSTQPEPFGLVLLEAMATARPVVATNHGGPTEICVHGETGLLVPPSDPDALADAMVSLLRDQARARLMGLAGRRRVENHYDLRASVRAIERVYDELLSA